MSSPSEPNDEPRADTAGERNPAPRIIRSEEIFQGRTEVWIEHGADMYRLSVTALLALSYCQPQITRRAKN